MNNNLIKSIGDFSAGYQHAVNLWRCADWETIVETINPIEDDESRRSILIIILAAAHIQVGDLEQYKILIDKVKNLNCDREILARVFISCALTSLGRSAYVSDNEKLASYYFHKAAEAALPENEIALFSMLRVENEQHRIAKDLALKSSSALLKLMKKEVCFIHIPKTAGKSINKALYGEERTWDELADHSSIREHRYQNNRYRFCSIRNPFSYYVSIYNFFLKYKDDIKNPLRFISSDLSFPEYLYVITDRQELEKYVKRKNINLFGLEKRYLLHGNDEAGILTNFYLDLCFDDPKITKFDLKYIFKNHDKLFSLDAVIRQENLEDDFTNLMKSWKLPELKLEKLNESPHKTWQYYYENDSLKNIVIEKDWLFFKLYYPEILSNYNSYIVKH